MKRLVHCVRV